MNIERGPRSPDEIVEFALRDTNDTHVVVTPLAWQPDNDGGRYWYFLIATSERNRGFRCDQVLVDTDDREQERSSVLAAFFKRRPLVVHDTDDELTAIWLCETLWPGQRVTELRRQVEGERT